MRRLVLVVTLCLGSPAMCSIIPQPREMTPGTGGFTLAAHTPLLVESGEPVLRRAMPVAVEMMAAITGDRATLGEADAPRDGAVFLGRLAGQENAEEYTLEVTTTRVVLRAGGPTGLIHGLASLRQLAGTGNEVPAVVIADGPRFPWRGVMLDCCRHYMSVEFIEDVLDLMALYKLNRFHWHLTEDQAWRLAIDRYPRLTEVGAWRTEPDGSTHGGFYTQDDARRHRGVRGRPRRHGRPRDRAAGALARGDRGVPAAVVHRQDTAGAMLVGRLRGRLLRGQRGGLHVPDRRARGGACHLPRRGRSTSAATRCPRTAGARARSARHASQRRVSPTRPRCRAGSCGASAPGSPRATGAWWAGTRSSRAVRCPDGAVVQSWRGLEGAVAAARAGHDVVVSPTSHCYLDYDLGVTDLARAYSFEPVPVELSTEEARHVLGGEMNLWTEYAPQDLAMGRLLPRLLALSEALWSPAPPLAAAAGPKVGDPALIGRDFTEFWGRVQGQYALLDALGAPRGHEARPLTLSADWEPQLGAWQVSGAVSAVVPAGPAVIRWRRAKVRRRRTTPRSTHPRWCHRWSAVGAALRRRRALRRSGDHRTDAQPRPRTAGHRRAGTEREVHAARDLPGHRRRPRQPRLPRRHLAGVGRRRGVVAVLDLGEVVPVQTIRARFLQNANSWIWVPLEVAFAVSTTGESYREIGRDACRVSDLEQARVTQDFVASADTGTTARFVKITITPRAVCPGWHPGVGRPAWVFWGQAMVD